MGIFEKILNKIKRKNSVNSEQGHRLIYYGDVPTIDPTDADYLKDLNETAPVQNQDQQRAKAETEDGGEARRVPSASSFHSSKAVRPSQSKPNVALQRAKNRDFTDNEIKSSRYTLLNFIPKNLFEQFLRLANFYFLCMVIIQTTIKDSPVHPFTAAVPLIFVILTTAIKQGYEDWLRHKADANVNNRPVCVIRDQQLLVVKSKEVKVGDIVKLEGEDQVPADILVVGSSDEFLRCQITTANLDGETNLKMRYCPAGLLHLKHEKDFSRLHIILECEQPNHSLYEFNGCLLVPPSRMAGSFSESNNSFRENTQRASDGVSSSRAPGIQTPTGSFVKRSSRDDNNYLNTSTFYTIPLSMENMILRGARLKNTEFIFGLVVYTGRDTRLAQNSKQSTIKHSTVEITENHFLFVFIAILLLMVVSSTAGYYGWENSNTIDNAEYLGPELPANTAHYWADNFKNIVLSFFILFNYIIPISLYVTVELQKFFGSKYFVWDLEMTCSMSQHPPLCNTSDLNEELGQIEYLFTDKTGTLTENIMQFRHVSIAGVNYDFVEDSLYLRDGPPNADIPPVDIDKDESIKDFLKVLALCHSVQLMPIRRPSFESTNPSLAKPVTYIKTAKMRAASSLVGLRGNSEPAVGILGKWEYQASSPDEKALLESCYKLEVKYLGEREEMLTLDVFGKVENFRRHFILEFDPDRKCMSVIVENSKGDIWLLSKGAESSIIPRCDTGNTQAVLKSVVEFAMIGMRTLVVAKRKVSRDELHKFSHKLKAARRLIKGRDEAMRDLYRSMESHLDCVGATGVEDQLQSGVPEMLMALNAAGIKIWMLTGDKIETGVSVGVACGLITHSSRQFYATNGTDKDVVRAHLEQIKKDITPDDNTTLILDGSTLEIAFNECPDLLRDIAMTVYRVICCRMAPLQKAKIVHMVKQSKHRPITAAVGDGANDVAMIQEAHIGIGILGKEGRQAARSADFALARSAFVKKAVLVHGHWYYVRLAILVMYFFYKNIVFIGPQFIYCFYTAFSTQTLYDGWSLMLYNIFYTSCPIFTYGLQEQPFSSKVLMDNPYLYQSVSRNRLLTWGQFAKWCIFAIWHSLVCFFIPYFAWPIFSPIGDMASFGTVCYCCVVGVVNLKLAIETKFVSPWTVFSYIFSFGTMIILNCVYYEANLDFYMDGILSPGDYRHVYFTVLSNYSFWIVIVVVHLIALAPDVMLIVYLNSDFRFRRLWRFFPKDRKGTKASTVYLTIGPTYLGPIRMNSSKTKELVRRVSVEARENADEPYPALPTTNGEAVA